MKNKLTFIARAAAGAMLSATILMSGCALPDAGLRNTDSDKDSGTDAAAKIQVADNSDNFKSILDFGAVGNGRQDCRAEIQEAVNTIQSEGGGTLYFPQGTYRVSGPIRITRPGTAPVTLMGDSAGGTSIKSVGDFTGDTLYINHPYVTVRNISIDNGSADGAAVMLKSDYCTLDACGMKISNTKNESPAIVVYGSYNTIKGAGYVPDANGGYFVRFACAPGIKAVGNTLEDCYFGGQCKHSVLVDSDIADSCQRNLTICRNVFLLPAVGQVELRSVDSCDISNNMMDAGNISLVMDPEGCGISNLSFTNNYCGASSGGVHTRDDRGGTIKNVIISSNYFWTRDSISIVSEKFTDFTITDNYFVISAGIGLYIKSSVNNYIEGTTVAGIGDTEAFIKIDDVDEKTVIINNTFNGHATVPGWDERFSAGNQN